MSTLETIIRTVGLTKTYGRTVPVHALRDVSFEVRQGERIGLLGQSGSGKSTLLNLLGGLDRPTSGSIQVCGDDLQQRGSKHLAGYRLHTAGMIFQSFNLIPTQTAMQNVVLPLMFAGHAPAQRRKAAEQALERVGLKDRLHHRPGELSGGEQQRVAIARALINEPALLLADEPTGNLDSGTAGEILDLLNDYVSSHGTTLLMVTHDEHLARSNTDRILRLHDGQLVEDVSPKHSNRDS